MGTLLRPLVPVLASLFLCMHAFAAIDVYQFANDAERARFNRLSDELRCPMCLNTNLAGSDAPIAADLRREIHTLIREGRSDDEIRDFMVQRYGDFILYRPPLRWDTALLWVGPTVLLVIGALVVVLMVWRRRGAGPAAISADEEARLARLLARDDP